MKLRWSLSTKILLVAFLNVTLLALVFLVFAHVQFRFEIGSFLLEPARDRMLSVTRQIALELPTDSRDLWNGVLARYSASYRTEFYLFDSDGQELAGPPVKLPVDLLRPIQHDPFGRAHTFRERPPDPPGPGSHLGPGPQSLMMIKTSAPSEHWILAHIPVFTTGLPEPIHGNLVMRLDSLWLNPFFDFRPWVAVALAVTFVSVLCWLPLIRGLTHSIGELTSATGQIAQGRFELQLPKHRRDELGQLAESINRMAQRLSGFVHGQKRFLGDIAHELCSPIARIQVALGILEQRAADDELDYVLDLKAEVDHMSTLVNELLSFSKAQMGVGTELTTVNVAQTMARVIERERTNSVEIKQDVNDQLKVIGQPDYVYRSFANVIRNAIRYAGEAGPILVSTRNGDGMIAICVVDQGPGVPESELDDIFKPFYRPELARTRASGGAGLGLAIVKNCVEACGGTVTCRNRSPKGFEVEMRLVAAD